MPTEGKGSRVALAVPPSNQLESPSGPVQHPYQPIILRLARYFRVSEGFWPGLQSDHDLLRQRRKISAELDRIELRPTAA